MCTSRKKSSFRIDDILRQQSEQQKHHEAMAAYEANFNNNYSIYKQKNDHIDVNLSFLPSHPNVIVSNSIANCTSTGIGLQPQKPMPLYAPPPPSSQLMDAQKANICFPLTIGVPHFPPATTAYLDHYSKSKWK